MTPFDLARTPLQPGTTLIEASAGTGKTYTIAGLFLRLVLEERLPIRSILAVTFTKAATEELRERVRQRLRDALGALRDPHRHDEIIAHFLAQGGDPAEAIRHLDLALQSFDEAQIFTIHGFCQRVLRENAFESGVLFDLELLTDPAELFQEVARDFWRNRFYTAPPLIVRLALEQKLETKTWIDLLQRTRNHPQLHLLPGPDELSCADLSGQLVTLFEETRCTWLAARAEIIGLFGTCQDFNRELNKERLCEFVTHMDLLASQDLAGLPAHHLCALTAFSTSNIADCLRARKTAPVHSFFEQCQQFKVLTQRFFDQLNHEFLAEAATALPRTKASRNLHTYDDLLTQMQRALAQPGGSLLAATLRAQYRAALIDEFQDTDPLQYDIFHQLFGGGAHHFYTIGDPKQAIYAFRGADIFTYFKAAKAADRRFTLQTNYRSEATLLNAINILFSNAPEPFATTDIRYRPLACGAATPLLHVDETPASMRFRWLRAESDYNQSDAEAHISQAVVADIAALLAGGATLGDRALRGRDIAVLTRTNPQASKLQRLLRRQGIPSVLQTEESVFQTEEAADLLRVMRAVIEPGRDSVLKTALATPFVGVNALEIYALQRLQQSHQQWLELFLGLRERWEAGGFMSMFREALVRIDVRRKLITQPGGERVLTNFLHLSELMHEVATEQRLAPEALCEWLRGQMNDSGSRAEEAQLRLESDEDAVTLVTIHKSKGLEYPVVFCPFLWKPSTGKMKPAILFHDEETRELTYDLRGGDDRHAALARAEQHQEALRILYVAVTRAQSGCFLYGGDIQKSGESALEHLLHGSAVKQLVEKSGGTMAVSEIDIHATVPRIAQKDIAPVPLAARSFTAIIPPQRMIASFTSLTSGRAEETPDRDDVLLEEPLEGEQSETSPLDQFDRGVRAGLFLHDVLEHCDFQKSREHSGLVAKKLASHGLSQEWRLPLARQIQLLLKAELAPGVSLSKVANAQRLNEVEFSYPITSLRPGDLRAVFERHRSTVLPRRLPESLGRLQFDPIAGTMRGFMDLLFQHGGRTYLVDWKSNWLGSRLNDYEGAPLDACMLQHSYHLQYHLYTVATDLFLRQRQPGYRYKDHFGGVFYVFLRGVDSSQPTRGIFHSRPDAGLIEELRVLFTGRRK